MRIGGIIFYFIVAFLPIVGQVLAEDNLIDKERKRTFFNKLFADTEEESTDTLTITPDIGLVPVPIVKPKFGNNPEGNIANSELNNELIPNSNFEYSFGNRVGLVIGNSLYQSVNLLPNATRDAELIAAAMRAAGISDVTVALNQSRGEMEATLRQFAAKADEADWAVIYYAGHGIEVDGANYLIPVDAELARDRDVKYETVSLDQINEAVENVKILSLIFLDACRDNPFQSRMRSGGAKRSIGRGLAPVEPDGNTAVMFAAKQGATASDGDGANSPFATVLAREMVEPGVELNLMLRRVTNRVKRATNSEQQPFVYASLPETELYFARRDR